MMKLDAILRFCQLLMQFQAVERFGFEPPEGFRENDAEHSYSLTMMAWYICSVAELPINTDLVRQYALVHDLVEVYAGDTPAFDPSHMVKASKHIREELALSILRQEHGDFPELEKLIRQYETREDPESRFVYALDKIMPSLMIYLNQSNNYISQGTNLSDIITYIEPKVALDPTIAALWSEFKPLLEARPELFTKQT